MMTSGKLQSKLIKFLDKTLLKEIKSALKLADREKMHSFSKAFRFKLDSEINKQSRELDSIYQNMGEMPSKSFKFKLRGQIKKGNYKDNILIKVYFEKYKEIE